MTGSELLNGLNHISDTYIDEAEYGVYHEYTAKRWHGWVSAAACLCILMLGMALYLPIGSNTDNSLAEGAQNDAMVEQDGQEAATGTAALPFQAQLIRTDHFMQVSSMEPVSVVSSVSELEAVYDSYLQQIYPGGDSDQLSAVVKGYTESYFEDNTLVLIALKDANVNMEYQVTDVMQQSDGSLRIVVNKRQSGASEEKAEWYLLLSVGTKIPFAAENVSVLYTVEEG